MKLLSVAFEVPVLGRGSRRLTARPRIDETVVAGVQTTVARPGHGRDWPGLVFMNGVTARGRFHPAVVRLAEALARIGFLVAVPDPQGLARGELTERTLAETIGVVQEVAGRPDARNGRVGLIGVSFGVSLGLVVAEQPGLADRVSVVAGVAPYVDFVDVVRLATTGSTYEQGHPIHRATPPFMGLVVARSLLAGLPARPERAAILAELLQLPDDEPHPLALFSRVRPADLDPETRVVAELLANDDPTRFDDLYAALPAPLRAGLERLSPLTGAGALLAPVEIASAPHDTYLPLSEIHRLGRAATRTQVRLTLTSTLDHAVPRLSPSDLGGVIRFDGFLVRVIAAGSRA